MTRIRLLGLSAGITALLAGLLATLSPGTAEATDMTANPTSFSVDPTSATVPAAGTIVLTPTVTYDDGTTLAGQLRTVDLISWACEACSVPATSNGPVTVTAPAAGSEATVTAVLSPGGFTSVVSLHIVPALSAISIAAPDQPISTGDVTQLTATAHYWDGSTADVTDEVTWTSSSDTRLAFDTFSSLPRGQALGVGQGSVTVTAKLDGVSSSLPLVVQAAAPQISGMSPDNGAPGTVVTITGSHFTPWTAVMFGGVPAGSITVESSTQLSAVVPGAKGRATVELVTIGGVGTASQRFRVTT